MKSNRLFPLAATIVLASGSKFLFAAAPVFSGASGGNWNTAGNWTPSGIPLAADTATFTNAAVTNVRLDGTTNTSSHMTFGNGVGCSITNDSGDTAKIVLSTKTITVSDASNLSINLNQSTI